MSNKIELTGRYTETGALWQQEYAKKAAEKGNTAIGIKYKEGILLAVEKNSTSKIVDLSKCMCISGLSNGYAMTYSGLAHDNNVVSIAMKRFAKDYIREMEREPSTAYFLNVLQKYLIDFGSYTGLRPAGCEFLLSAVHESEHALYHADTFGSINRCTAYATGVNAKSAKTELEKIDFSGLSFEDAVQCAVRVFFLSRDAMAEGPFEIEMMHAESGSQQKRVPQDLIQKYVQECSMISMHE